MNIVFATDQYWPSIGGQEITTRRYAEALSRRGHKVFVIAPSWTKGEAVKYDNGVKIVGVKAVNLFFNKKLRYSPYSLVKRRIFKILKEVDPDIIHIQSVYSISKAASIYAQKNIIPSVATSHFTITEGLQYVSLPKVAYSLVKFVLKNFSLGVWKNVGILTYPSSFSKDYLKSFIGSDLNTAQISNGVDIHLFKPAKKSNKKRTDALFVGRLELVKQLDVVIKSIPEVVKRFPNFSLTIVGDGSQRPYLEELTEKLGVRKNIKFVGAVSEEETQKWYKQARVFVTASELETQGLAVLEAAASGLPIVATNTGAIPEAVHDGENGYLFGLGDYHSLAMKLIKIVNDESLAKKMGEQSIKIAKTHDIEEVVFKMEAVYERAIVINDIRLNGKGALVINYQKLFVKLSIASVMCALIFKWSFGTPSVASAKGVSFAERVKSTKVAKEIIRINKEIKEERKYNIYR